MYVYIFVFLKIYILENNKKKKTNHKLVSAKWGNRQERICSIIS